MLQLFKPYSFANSIYSSTIFLPISIRERRGSTIEYQSIGLMRDKLWIIGFPIKDREESDAIEITSEEFFKIIPKNELFRIIFENKFNAIGPVD